MFEVIARAIELILKSLRTRTEVRSAIDGTKRERLAADLVCLQQELLKVVSAGTELTGLLLRPECFDEDALVNQLDGPPSPQIRLSQLLREQKSHLLNVQHGLELVQPILATMDPALSGELDAIVSSKFGAIRLLCEKLGRGQLPMTINMDARSDERIAAIDAHLIADIKLRSSICGLVAATKPEGRLKQLNDVAVRLGAVIGETFELSEVIAGNARRIASPPRPSRLRMRLEGRGRRI